MEQSKVSLVEMIPTIEKLSGLISIPTMNFTNTLRLWSQQDNLTKFGINNTLRDTAMIISMHSQEVKF